MNLLSLVNRSPFPQPWSEADNIPWNDPAFSERMLKEHLRQDHDRASRRAGKIDRQVDWIHHGILSGTSTRVLDLGCGPGFYTSRLSRLGHDCTGIDYSPASIAYALEQSRQENPGCVYLQEDIRTAEYGSGYGLVMLIFGELNTFRPSDARLVLRKAYHALADDGILLLEPHTFAAVQGMGQTDSSWYSAKSGFFSEKPYLNLRENFWDPSTCAFTRRDYVIDASTGHVMRYAQSLQAYTDSQYRSLLGECGFGEIEFFPSLTGVEDESQGDLIAIRARKAG